MQLIIILGVIAKLALVSGDCDVGKTVNDFDFTKFTGTWYYLFYEDNEYDNELACSIEHYGVPVGNVSNLTSYDYLKREKKEEVSNGFALNWDNTGYSIKYDTDSIWDGRMYIAAVDYDSYFIGKFCSEELNKLFQYVAFRSANPNKAAPKALKDSSIARLKLRIWKSDRCAKLQRGR